MYNSPDTYNLYYNDEYAFNASTSGIEIYDVDAESVVKYVSYHTTHSGADSDTVTSVWATPTKAYLGTTNSGIYTLGLGYITSVSGVVDLASYLVPFKSYPDITDNHVRYIHGSGDYMCVTTISGVDHFNFGSSDAYDRSYTMAGFVTKCHQTSRGRFYYLIAGSEISGWPFKMPITLSPVTPAANYQVQVTLTVATVDYSKIAEDGDDIRFYDGDLSALDYYIETWDGAGNSTIWVEVKNSGTDVIYMYYGNPYAAATSSPEDTFELYYEFGAAGDINDFTNDWYPYLGAGVPNRYNVTHDAGEGLPAPSIKMDMDHPGGGADGAYFLITQVVNNDFCQLAIQADYRAVSTFAGSSVTNAQTHVHKNQALSNASHIWQHRWYNGGVLDTGWASGAEQISHANTALYSSVKVGFGSHDGWAADYSQVTRFDNIRVRKYDSPEPAATLEAEYPASSLNVIYTHQCDWDGDSIGYIYDLTASGSLFPANSSINDIHITEGTSTYGQNNNLIFAATSNGVVLIEERPGDEANSRYKQYFVEA